VTVPCSPFVRPEQQVLLAIGDQMSVADPFTAATNTPSFTYPNLQPTTAWCARGFAWTASKAASSIARRRRRRSSARSYRSCDGRRTRQASRSWLEQNQAYLSAEFARLRDRLRTRRTSSQNARPHSSRTPRRSGVDGIDRRRIDVLTDCSR
jgi:hypothetical protein